MIVKDSIAVLRQVPLFGSLDDDELSAVARCIVPRTVRAGERLIEEGQPGEALHVVLSGSVRVGRRSGGKEVTLSTLGSGTTFGEMSLLDASPTSASVAATEDTELLSIGRHDLAVLLSWDTVLAAKLWRSFALQLSRRLRDTNQRVLDRYGAEVIDEHG